MRFLPLFLVLLLPPLGGAGQGVGLDVGSTLHLHATVSMDGDGFMCPFLTPQFLDVIGSRAHWVEARPLDSEVEFAIPMEQAWSQHALIDMLSDIGYPADGAHILQWDTVGVIPSKPTP